jgi:polyisoprenoid-binding protein YceI
MRRPVIAIALVALGSLAVAQNLPTEAPGKPDPTRVTAGTYSVDPAHTQLAFKVDHLGFNPYHGLFGNITGTLTLDPAKPDASKLSIDIPMSGIVTTSLELNEHLRKPEFFDAARYTAAHFESTSVTASGTNATIAGNLTIKGVTKAVVLQAHFTGAGKGPMNGVETVGFEATTTVRRSDFGVSYGIPLVSDEVPLEITAAFEKKPA